MEVELKAEGENLAAGGWLGRFIKAPDLDMRGCSQPTFPSGFQVCSRFLASSFAPSRVATRQFCSNTHYLAHNFYFGRKLIDAGRYPRQMMWLELKFSAAQHGTPAANIVRVSFIEMKVSG